MVKIAVCAGHGFNTQGKRSPDGEREWSFNDKVCRAFISEISKYQGVEVRRFDDPTGAIDVPLSTRTNGANTWGADLYISFHHNGLAGKWGTHGGVETHVYLTKPVGSVKVTNAVHPEIVKAYGLRDRGIKYTDLHITRETNCDAILIEGGFMDSATDIIKLRNDAVLANAGIGTAQGVAKLKGLQLKQASKPKPTPVPIIKEEDDMLETIVVINSFVDYPTASPLATRLGTGIVERGVAELKQLAKKAFVVGGTRGKVKANEFVELTGPDRYATAAAVKKYLG